MTSNVSLVSLLFVLGVSTSNAFTNIAPHNAFFFSATPKSFGRTSSSKKNADMNMIDPSSISDAFSSAYTALADIDVDAVVDVASDAVSAVSDSAATAVAPVEEAAAAVTESSYSKVSYYSTLALYLISFPGLWSTIKRSTTAKIKKKTYVSAGENAPEGKDLRQQAGEIMAYMKANNYEVTETGETITFRGIVARSTSQAFFLTFCTALGLASFALVLQIQLQDLVLPGIGKPNWFYLVLLSPYAGLFYWNSGDRVDDIQVKLSSNDDDTQNQVAIMGNDEELDRFWRALGLVEQGMVRVEGIFD